VTGGFDYILYRLPMAIGRVAGVDITGPFKA
jgi:hypothetical protein